MSGLSNRRIGLVQVSVLLAAALAVAPAARAAQVDATWGGTLSSDWNNGGNWSPLGVPNNGNNANTYRVFIDHGSAALSTVGLNINAQIDTLTLDAGDALVIGNNLVLALAVGPIDNNGTLYINAGIGGGNNTDLRMDADILLTGSGSIVMSNTGTNRIYGNLATRRLTNVGNTIRGSGQIGVNSMALTNQAIIQADQTAALTIDPSASGVINTGTLRATNNATLNLTDGNFDNTGGTIEAQTGSAVSINSTSVISGFLTTSGTGVVILRNSALTSPTNNGQLTVPNLTVSGLVGTVTNNATITLDAVIGAGNNTDLVMYSDVTLTGGGTVTMSNTATNRIYALPGTNRLTNANNLIRGSGQIGVHQLPLTNQSVIQADQSAALTIDPGAAGVINTGTLQAISGATLNLSSGSFDNTNGTILAQNASTVALNSASVTSGILTTSGTGVIFLRTSALHDPTNNGQLTVPNNTFSGLFGTVTNNATITLDAVIGAGNNTDLVMYSDVTLTGGGTVTMSNTGSNRIRSDTPTLRLTNVNNVIRGSGQIGTNTMALTNLSIIQADQSSPLTIDPSASGVINTGTLRATNNATLNLTDGNFDNTGGTIEAQTGSAVSINSTSVISGFLTTSGTGVIFLRTSALHDPTNNGQLTVPNNTFSGLFGTVTNNATITLDAVIGAGNNTDLIMYSDVNLLGSGIVTMSSTGTNRIYGSVANYRLTNYGNTIQGGGQIGVNSMALTNWGTIDANAAATLTIDVTDSEVFNNIGQLKVTGAGGLIIATGGFTTSGAVTINATRQLSRTGTYTQTGGTTIADGTLSATGGVALQGGVLKGSGTVSNAVNNTGGAVLPGDSPGALAVSGTYTQAAGGSLYIELGGTTAGTFDVLNVTGAATLAGTLRVTAVNGFVPTLGQTFVILTTSARTGTFGAIQTFDFPAGLTVQANYNTTNVTLQVIAGSGAILGDMNCDNAVTLLDIPLFIQAVLDPATYTANNPGCFVTRADMNSDGFIDGRDIQGFTTCETGGGCP